MHTRRREPAAVLGSVKPAGEGACLRVGWPIVQFPVGPGCVMPSMVCMHPLHGVCAWRGRGVYPYRAWCVYGDALGGRGRDLGLAM